MTIMKTMYRRIILLFWGIFLLGGLNYVMAQNVGIGTSSPTDSLSFGLVALDYQTKGKVTQDTHQIQFGLTVQNKSSNIYSLIKVTPTSLTVANFPEYSPQVTALGPFATNTWSNAFPFSQHIFNLLPPPTVATLNPVSNPPITPVSTSNPIVATMDVNVQLFSSMGNTIYNTEIQEIIYKPSNDDLIPQIAVGVGTETQQLSIIQNQGANILSNIGIGSTSVFNQLNVLQNGEKTIEGQDNQILNKLK